MKAEKRVHRRSVEALKKAAGCLVTLVIFVAMVVVIADFVRTATPLKLLSWAVFMVVIIALGVLSVRFKIIDRTIRKAFGAYFLSLGWLFITLAPVVLFLRLSLLVLERRDLALRLAVFIAWGLLLTFALLLIATERNRERLFNRLKRLGHFAPVSYSLNLLMISVLFFSSVTYALAESGVLELNGSQESKVSRDQVTALYLWNFLEAVPLLAVNETLRWKEPLTYDSGWVGLTLLIFKLAVIIPVIGAFAGYWKQAGAQKPGATKGLLKMIGAARFMKVVIVGGTGQVGTILAREFYRRGDEVVVLSRNPNAAQWRIVTWDAETLGDWAAELDGSDVVINLAGRSVNCRYNTENRRRIKESRVKSTQLVGEAIARASSPPRVWLQASTATIYAHSYDTVNDEATGIVGCSEDAPDTWHFSHDVVTSWERALNESVTPNTRKVLLRSAMVMSPDRGGVFDTLLRLVRYGLGGRAGDGKQYVSWIHERDFIRSIYWLILHKDIEGPVNLAAPNPIPNAEFMKALRKAWGVRFGLPATDLMLKIGAFFLRSETELILKSRRVVPGRLLQSGFAFQFPRWTEAANDLCARWRASA